MGHEFLKSPEVCGGQKREISGLLVCVLSGWEKRRGVGLGTLHYLSTCLTCYFFRVTKFMQHRSSIKVRVLICFIREGALV